MIPKFFIYSLLLILIVVAILSILAINSRACVDLTKKRKSKTVTVNDSDSRDCSSETDVKSFKDIKKSINKNKLKVFRKNRKLRNTTAIIPMGDKLQI